MTISTKQDAPIARLQEYEGDKPSEKVHASFWTTEQLFELPSLFFPWLLLVMTYVDCSSNVTFNSYSPSWGTYEFFIFLKLIHKWEEKYVIIENISHLFLSQLVVRMLLTQAKQFSRMKHILFNIMPILALVFINQTPQN